VMKLIFAVLYVSLNDRPYTFCCYKTKVFLHLFMYEAQEDCVYICGATLAKFP